MEMLSDILPIILYLLLAILVLVLIILIIRLIKTLSKVDKIVEDVANKSSKLDGVFNFIDNTTDTLNIMSDKLASMVVTGISNVFKRKTKGEDENE